jgi:hypothetical protein
LGSRSLCLVWSSPGTLGSSPFWQLRMESGLRSWLSRGSSAHDASACRSARQLQRRPRGAPQRQRGVLTIRQAPRGAQGGRMREASRPIHWVWAAVPGVMVASAFMSAVQTVALGVQAREARRGVPLGPGSGVHPMARRESLSTAAARGCRTGTSSSHARHASGAATLTAGVLSALVWLVRARGVSVGFLAAGSAVALMGWVGTFTVSRLERRPAARDESAHA